MRKLVIALLLLTCFASPVSAGCAWVLWSYDTDMTTSETNRTNFFPQEAYQAKAECEKENTRRTQMEENAAKREIASGSPLKKHVFFRCLPDTVDPRAPKGK